MADFGLRVHHKRAVLAGTGSSMGRPCSIKNSLSVAVDQVNGRQLVDGGVLVHGLMRRSAPAPLKKLQVALSCQVGRAAA
jgi:hypothetical protein